MSHSQNTLPAVAATVFLCDPVLIVPPDVNGWEDQRRQRGKAAEKGEDGDGLLLVLEDEWHIHTEPKPMARPVNRVNNLRWRPWRGT